MVYIAGLRGLLPTFGLIYGFQAACAAVAVPYKTEKYYDLCGSLGFISAAAFSILLPSLRTRFPQYGFLLGKDVAGRAAGAAGISSVAGVWPPTLSSLHPRALIMSGMTLFWAIRLGSFLFSRIQQSGHDSRFDKIKESPTRFFTAWMMQATWIAVTALPVYLVNAVPPARQPKLGASPLDWIGLAVWLAGMGLEITADSEKTKWRQDKKNKKHEENFITSGTWAWSRHPNYFGEVTLWTGQYILSLSALRAAGAAGFLPGWTPLLAAASPLLEYGLIRYLSGVPPLERAGDKKFKDDPKWQEYKKTVPVFVPFIGGTK